MAILFEKTYQYLIHLFDSDETRHIHEILVHSEHEVDKDQHSRFNLNLLTLRLDPEVYKKYNSRRHEIEKEIIIKLQDLPNDKVGRIHIEADLEKFQLLSNRYQTILSPWTDINADQETLISQLRTAQSTVDFQNIGNTSRTILQKLASHLFNPNIHIASPGIDLSEGKYKNRLHTIVKYKFEGSQLKELEKYAESLITTAEKSVDLCNKLTHDLKANKLMAELSVLSVLNVIGVMKVIESMN